MNWKRIRLPLLGLVFIVITSATVSRCMFKKPDFDRQMRDFALELNKQAPFMVDEQTRFDSASVLSNQQFGFYYTLPNVNAAKDSIDAKGFELVFRPVLEDFVRTNPDMKAFRDNKATILYNYHDSCGRFLTKIQITPQDIE